MKAYRQGEILIVPLTQIVDTNRLSGMSKDNSGCIREGEVTGHKHQLVGNYELYTSRHEINGFYMEDGQWLKVPNGSMLVRALDNNVKLEHPEHKTISIPKGDSIIRIQREYNEATHSRQVLD